MVNAHISKVFPHTHCCMPSFRDWLVHVSCALHLSRCVGQIIQKSKCFLQVQFYFLADQQQTFSWWNQRVRLPRISQHFCQSVSCHFFYQDMFFKWYFIIQQQRNYWNKGQKFGLKRRRHKKLLCKWQALSSMLKLGVLHRPLMTHDTLFFTGWFSHPIFFTFNLH